MINETAPFSPRKNMYRYTIQLKSVTKERTTTKNYDKRQFQLARVARTASLMSFTNVACSRRQRNRTKETANKLKLSVTHDSVSVLH